jgi:hypothetical protein
MLIDGQRLLADFAFTWMERHRDFAGARKSKGLPANRIA